MKKIFILFVCAVMAWSNAFAQPDEPEIIMYEANGETYFITGELLEQLKQEAQNTCLDAVREEDGKTNQSNLTTFYELLLKQCRHELADTADQLKKEASGPLEKAVAKGLSKAAGAMNTASKKGWIPLSIVEEYRSCLLTQLSLKSFLQPKSNETTAYRYTMNADIDACIKNIAIHSDVSTCPIKTSVESQSVIADMLNMNAEYKGKTVTFSEKPDINPGQVLVFNGQLLVVCDNGNPVSIIKPAFSGYVACRDAEFQVYPNVGSTPDGIYLAQKAKVQKHADLKSWGGYRIPLLPAHQTETYGRGNMYFHGTSDASKKRSGGCISLGVAIDDFINGDWFTNHAKDLLIIVDTL